MPSFHHLPERVLTIEVGWRKTKGDFLATLLDEVGIQRGARSGDTPDAAVRDLLITNLNAIYTLADVGERCRL